MSLPDPLLSSNSRVRLFAVTSLLLVGYWLLVLWLLAQAAETLERDLRKDALRAAEHVADSLLVSLDMAQGLYLSLDQARAQIPDPYTVGLITAPAARAATDKLDALWLDEGGFQRVLARRTDGPPLPPCRLAKPTQEELYTLDAVGLQVTYPLTHRWVDEAVFCVLISAERLQQLKVWSAADAPLTFALEVGEPGTDAGALVQRGVPGHPLQLRVDALPGALRTLWWQRVRYFLLGSLLFTGLVLITATRVLRYIRAIEFAATRDGLTGLYNRRHFRELAERELLRHERQQAGLALLLVDVDHFKQINDQHGHAVGDQVLQTLAARLQDNLRAADLLCRYGGEEFMVLICPAASGEALRLAERLRLVICETPVETSAGPLRVTLSGGLIELASGQAVALDQLSVQADAALYRAKQAGRNRIDADTCHL